MYENELSLLDQIINSASNITVLAPINEHCDEVILKVFDLIPENSRLYLICNHVIIEDKNEVRQYPTEFLNSYKLSGLPPHIFELKSSASVILLGNLKPSHGLLNWTILIIKNTSDNFFDIEITTGNNLGAKVLLSGIILMLFDTSLPFSFKRWLTPIRLALS